ncbi:MAG: transcriptional regulator [Lysobacterales bacterium CG02_land_8_20_14_3_00_62_12]|nr:MAG: transcriptional regulator [Xanthomonadales bacterium CG02_land_8_20_14_3_00_62_12]
MPIYEYRCASCQTVFDVLQKMSDPAPSECPKCAHPQISRCVTAPSFRLAGSGWYETDFKKAGDHQRNLAGDSERSVGGSSDKTVVAPAKTDTAPAAPAATAAKTD